MNNFAAVTVIQHAEKLFSFHGIGITNSMLLGWGVSVVMTIGLIAAARFVKLRPGGKVISLVELLVESITNLAAEVMDRERAATFAPFLLTIFCFIMFNSWAGLLPGVSAITYHGVPLLRAWTSDLTGTLALSITSIAFIQIYTLQHIGLRRHAAHYFTKQPWNPINFFVGLLEVLSEFTRVASLALRLFGNIFAGEVLLVVLSSLTGLASPIATVPFILMEFFEGIIQAFVFMTLVIVYLAISTAHHEETEPSSIDHTSKVAEPTIHLDEGLA